MQQPLNEADRLELERYRSELGRLENLVVATEKASKNTREEGEYWCGVRDANRSIAHRLRKIMSGMRGF